MYELADRPPKAGSLRDSLFLTVWLRRQELELSKWRVVAQGLLNGKAVEEPFQALINQIFPFLKGAQKKQDKKMMELMRKEIAKGPIAFTPLLENPFKNRMKTMTLPDETMAKLRQSRRRRG